MNQRRLIPFLLSVALVLLVPSLPAETPRDLMQQGQQAFFDAKIDESLKAFDKLIELVPDAKPQLWQRGLTLYYAG